MAGRSRRAPTRGRTDSLHLGGRTGGARGQASAFGLGWLFRGREPIERDIYLTDLLAREAVEFIEANKERPFFLYVPFYAVHSPIQVTDEYYQRVGHYENETRRIFAGHDRRGRRRRR